MSDLVNDLLHLSDDPAMDSRESRRQVIDRLVQTLTEMMTAFVSHDDSQHSISIVRLVSVLQGMTSRIADADDATFSAIVRESALLLHTLERRRQEMARFTVH